MIDKDTILSDNQAITASADSTNVIDLQANQAGRDFDKGVGERISFLVQVTEDFNNLTSLDITVRNSANENMSSPTDVFKVTVPAAQLKAGWKLPVVVLPRGVTKRYLGIRYDVTGTAPTAGKVFAAVTTGVSGND